MSFSPQRGDVLPSCGLCLGRTRPLARRQFQGRTCVGCAGSRMTASGARMLRLAPVRSSVRGGSYNRALLDMAREPASVACSAENRFKLNWASSAGSEFGSLGRVQRRIPCGGRRRRRGQSSIRDITSHKLPQRSTSSSLRFRHCLPRPSHPGRTSNTCSLRIGQ